MAVTRATALGFPPTLTFDRRGFEAPADGFSVPISLLDLDHSLSAPQLHEGAELLQRAPELAPMARLVSLVFGVKVAVGHVTHVCHSLCSGRARGLALDQRLPGNGSVWLSSAQPHWMAAAPGGRLRVPGGGGG